MSAEPSSLRTSRRDFLQIGGAATVLAAVTPRTEAAAGQPSPGPTTKYADTPSLRIGYEESGRADGFPILLLHGFPDDVRAFDGVVPPLAAAGHRVLVPYLRGYGPTRFRDAAAPRMAQQAAIGQDVVDLADSLGLKQFAVAGYDWGGRAAAIAAALYPDRVRAAVLIGGYTVQNTVKPGGSASPEAEHRAWYQWYFHTERGRAGLESNRRALCRYLWQLWSPTWGFTDPVYDRTAASFDNPDFVDVVIHSYRHRHGNAAGEPRFVPIEAQLSKRPPVAAPAITLYGADDGVAPPSASAQASAAERTVLPKLVARRVIAGAGHFLPREQPEAVSAALLELLR